MSYSETLHVSTDNSDNIQAPSDEGFENPFTPIQGEVIAHGGYHGYEWEYINYDSDPEAELAWVHQGGNPIALHVINNSIDIDLGGDARSEIKGSLDVEGMNIIVSDLAILNTEQSHLGLIDKMRWFLPPFELRFFPKVVMN